MEGANMIKVTKVPARLCFEIPGDCWSRLIPFIPGRRDAGWGVFEFATAREAAAFVLSYPDARERCWHRWDIVDGELVRVR